MMYLGATKTNDKVFLRYRTTVAAVIIVFVTICLNAYAQEQGSQVTQDSFDFYSGLSHEVFFQEFTKAAIAFGFSMISGTILLVVSFQLGSRINRKKNAKAIRSHLHKEIENILKDLRTVQSSKTDRQICKKWLYYTFVYDRFAENIVALTEAQSSSLNQFYESVKGLSRVENLTDLTDDTIVEVYQNGVTALACLQE